MSPRPRAQAVPAPMDTHASRAWVWMLACALAAAAPWRAHAGDAPVTPKADKAAPTAKAAAAKPASAPAGEPKSKGEDPTVDGLDIVQRRLMEKFGGQTIERPGSGGPVLRVNARPAPTAGAAAAASATASQPAAQSKPSGHVHWSYDGAGAPDAWARLKPEFATCGTGKRQSPINIRDGLRVDQDPVVFEYKPSTFKVHDNGHTIQVNVAQGNAIEVMGQRYELQQFHFHRPSEEAIDGRRSDMVAHFVHKSLEGRMAVVAVLLERGSAQAQLQQVWNNLPLEKGDTVSARGTLDLERLLPDKRGYFTYMGSMTTPPCSEGVLWMVMKQPVQMSPEQADVFARLYPMNARPIQPTSGRLIKESN